MFPVALSYSEDAELSQHSCLVGTRRELRVNGAVASLIKGRQQPTLVGYLVACKGSLGGEELVLVEG